MLEVDARQRLNDAHTRRTCRATPSRHVPINLNSVFIHLKAFTPIIIKRIVEALKAYLWLVTNRLFRWVAKFVGGSKSCDTCTTPFEIIMLEVNPFNSEHSIQYYDHKES
jgi:hypothetical protein